jgi:YD repeat-containing protein
MRISYDPEVDALSIIFRDTTVTTQELTEGIAAEYDAQGRLVGIEILDAVKRLGDPSVLQQVILERFGPAAPSPPSRP